jgi:hypothetical protein
MTTPFAPTTTPVPYSPDEAEAIRASLVSRDGVDVCPRCGTILQATPPTTGADSMSLIWELTCPACQRVMIAGQVLDRLLEGNHGRPTEQDRAAARSLPDDFLKLAGKPANRAMLLVDRRWYAYPTSERRQLAQALVLLLSPVQDPSAISSTIRDDCERIAVEWIARTRFSPNRSAPRPNRSR